MVYFWLIFKMHFIQPFYISHFYMLLVLDAGPSDTEKSTMVWALVQ